MRETWVLVRVKVAGSPDDGMTPIYTGCIDGNGMPAIVPIANSLIVKVTGEGHGDE